MNSKTFKSEELSIVVAHAAIIVISFAAALWLRHDFFLSDFERDLFRAGLVIILPIKLLTFAGGGL